MEEQLFSAIGGFGRWQKRIYAVFFYANAVGIWQNFAMTFLAPNVPYRCVETRWDLNASDWSGQCTVQASNGTAEPCTRWEYDVANFSDTLVSKFDLVCDREWLVSFAKSVYMIGFMASVFLSGHASDRFGRRPTIIVCYVITCISCILTLVAPSIETFLLFRFLQAFGRTGYTTTGFVLVMETVGPRHRTAVGVTVQIGWCCGFLCLAFIGYFFRHWFWFQVAISLPLAPLALAFLFVPESPRWLLMRGRVESLEKLMIAAAQKNGRDLKQDLVKQLLKVRSADTEPRSTVLDLFRSPRMRGRTLNMMYLWIVNAFVYYALSFNTNDMSGNAYLNFLLAGALEFPSYGMLFLTVRRYGRRTVLVVLMILGGAACLALVAVPSDLVWLTMTFSQAGKFCITASFGLLYLYTGELFPTVVRSAALGSCSTVARIGSIVAPFCREMGKASHPSVPNVLYFVLALSSGLFALRLPETAGRRLPDTLEEGEAFELKD